MKKIFSTMVLVAACAFSTSLFAQSKVANSFNGYFVRFAEMLVMKDGKISRLDSDQKLPDGTIVYNNGSIAKAGGKPVFMSEGQKADLNGNILPESVTTTVTMQNGQMVMITDGIVEPLVHDLKLLNGSAILMDGTVYNSMGQSKISNGEKYNLNGEKLQN